MRNFQRIQHTQMSYTRNNKHVILSAQMSMQTLTAMLSIVQPSMLAHFPNDICSVNFATTSFYLHLQMAFIVSTTTTRPTVEFSECPIVWFALLKSSIHLDGALTWRGRSHQGAEVPPQEGHFARDNEGNAFVARTTP